MGHRPSVSISVCEGCLKDIQSKRSVGRPPNKNRKGTAYLLQFPDQAFIERLDVIAMREGITRKDLILKFIREGFEIHAPGNPQTLLNSYAEGGTQTINQLIGQIRQRFYKRGKATKSEILESLKEGDVPGTERIVIAKGIIKWLKDKGVKVW